MWFGETVDPHHVKGQAFLAHKLFRTYGTLEGKKHSMNEDKLIMCKLAAKAGFTLWGICPVWETMCKRSSSFPLNVEEHVVQVYFCCFKQPK